MATLTVRLHTATADHALRHAMWSTGQRGAVEVSRRSRQVALQVFELQPPCGPTSITLPRAQAALPATPADDAGFNGWFDSTWELQQGLDVAEGLPADLPLEAWLQVYLQA